MNKKMLTNLAVFAGIALIALIFAYFLSQILLTLGIILFIIGLIIGIMGMQNKSSETFIIGVILFLVSLVILAIAITGVGLR